MFGSVCSLCFSPAPTFHIETLFTSKLSFIFTVCVLFTVVITSNTVTEFVAIIPLIWLGRKRLFSKELST